MSSSHNYPSVLTSFLEESLCSDVRQENAFQNDRIKLIGLGENMSLSAFSQRTIRLARAAVANSPKNQSEAVAKEVIISLLAERPDFSEKLEELFSQNQSKKAG